MYTWSLAALVAAYPHWPHPSDWVLSIRYDSALAFSMVSVAITHSLIERTLLDESYGCTRIRRLGLWGPG